MLTGWAAWCVIAPAVVALPLALWSTSPRRPDGSLWRAIPAPMWCAFAVVVVCTAPWWPWPWGSAPR